MAVTQNPNHRRLNGKPLILGQSRSLSDQEAAMIQRMIREEQHSSRALEIPQEDLAQEATTRMRPEVAEVVAASRVREILQLFNRDYLYGQGRFDEYEGGLLLKWGDGYARKHIWVSVENGNLLFETSHFRKCSKPYCNGTHHVLSREQYTNIELINQELGELFRRPVQEPTDD
jgi:hypothetical protein